MKKTITILSMALLGIASLPSYAQFKLGVTVGVGTNSVGHNYKDSKDQKEADEDEKEAKDATKSKLGYTIGLAAEFGFTDALSLQTGLQLANKGYKIDIEEEEDGEKYSETGKLNLSYLEIPLNIAYKINKFQVHAGPYAGFALSGKSESEEVYTFNGETEKDSDKTTFKFKNTVKESDYDNLKKDEDFLRRMDLGLNFGIGYNVGPVLLKATYFKGLSNIYPTYESEDNDDDDSSYKTTNKGFRLAATWFF